MLTRYLFGTDTPTDAQRDAAVRAYMPVVVVAASLLVLVVAGLVAIFVMTA